MKMSENGWKAVADLVNGGFAVGFEVDSGMNPVNVVALDDTTVRRFSIEMEVAEEKE
ncbi:hypothetical protein F4560_004442 [Saccharothrix ecbatanensis]|uniref:Uncharacterized protein n=1 Tax=Saccharothrix ecbatanensis TaxID=1105145 RepID=A0A7W9M261_9PSEU|nr:hypothetical protein [Saccharothrix ecbatanensis]MBB5804674.1 hypothetical protein [Saccharothrix ecbatanensis]